MTRYPKSTTPSGTRLHFFACLLACLAMMVAATAVFAQSPPPATIRITAVDDSQFPQVNVNVITIASPGGPIPDLAGLSLRENGIPVAYETAQVPVGIDVTFVIDANGTMLDVDDDTGQTRWQKVQETISRFAADYMDPTGLDRVTIIVPQETGENGRFLIENATDPVAVQAAIEDLPPLLVSPTPLNAMMDQAIAQAAAQVDDGRYQAVLLLTDAGQIHLQLPFDELVQQAQTTDLPLFVGILGARADADELFRANRLAEPTLASSVHLPQPDAADAIFDIWAEQRSQLQLQYESLQQESGQYTLTLNQGEVRALATLDLTLLPPEVVVAPLESTVQREGGAPDTPLAELQPQHVPLPVIINWPDGKPRELLSLRWSVNGRPQVPPETLTPDAEGQLLLDWDVRTAAAGSYTIEVEITDELGFIVTSAPAIVEVVEERPSPPTATPLPTAMPTSTPVVQPVPVEALIVSPWLWLTLAAALVAALWLWLRQRRAAKAAAATVPEEPAAPDHPPEEDSSPAAEPLVAALEPFLGEVGAAGLIVLTQANTSIGRDTAVADLVLADASVARLHARIIRQDGSYWLYDEGSAAGTFHNYSRVGLAPQPLQDGDQIGLGRVQLHFRLRPAASLPLPSGIDEEE
ncbi:MAG: FHA domain-containing protein [Anaerolineales bacterium]|nr:FHA domain-containing protein [Anaerolineales bacterium]